MKFILSILLLCSLSSFGREKQLSIRQDWQGNWHWFTTYTYTPQDGAAMNGHSNGYLTIDGNVLTINPGDVFEFYDNGATMYWMEIKNVNGTRDNPVIFRNKAGFTFHVGDVAWPANNGQAQCITMKYCHYFKINGTTTDHASFIINGSLLTGRDAVRDLEMGFYTDNFEIYNITIQDGGNGVFWKTEVDGADANSWTHGTTVGSTHFPTQFNASDVVLHSGIFHDCTIKNTVNEGMYLGHTSEWWDLAASPIPRPFDPTSNSDYTACDASQSQTTAQYDRYKKPIRLDSAQVYNMYLENIQADAIQLAAVNYAIIHDNVIYKWAMKNSVNDLGGILIGGGVKNSDVYNNEVTWTRHGEPLQFYGSGGGVHSIHNNLLVAGYDSVSVSTGISAFYSSENNAISINPRGAANKGMDPNVYATFSRNTTHGGNTALRINGFFDDDPHVQVLNANIFIEVIFGYLYTENGGGYTEGTGGNTNQKYSSISASGVDRSNHYLPPVDLQGYRYVPGSGGGSPYTPTIKDFFIRHSGNRVKLKQG